LVKLPEEHGSSDQCDGVTGVLLSGLGGDDLRCGHVTFNYETFDSPDCHHHMK